MNLKAYNPLWAHHEAMRAAATRWQKRGLLSTTQLAAIATAHPLTYYRPNIFLRIILFVFTIIGLLAGSGFMALLFSGGLNSSVSEATLLITVGLLSIIGSLVLLEFAIRESRLYHSGIDNALLYYLLGWVVFLLAYLTDKTATNELYEGSTSTSFYTVTTLLLVLPVFLAATVRYADRLVAAAAYATYLLLLASLLFEFPVGRLVLPFAVMLASVAAYFLGEKLTLHSDYLYYKSCLQVLKVLSLLTFYLGGNYLVVREGNALLSGAVVSAQIPFAWLFYFFTAGTPIAYILVGLRRHDRIWLLVGLLIVVFSLYTLRHYRSALPPEIAATSAGVVLIAAMLWVTRYLRPPRHGLTTAADDEDTGKFNIESLIVAETATVPQPAAAGFEFGGGSSGGGGADGSY